MDGVGSEAVVEPDDWAVGDGIDEEAAIGEIHTKAAIAADK